MITRADIKIRVERCVDDTDQWVWSLLDEYNGVRMDGYSGTEKEAHADALAARDEEIARLNSGE